MLVKIVFKDDVPMGMVKTLIAGLHDHVALFSAAASMKVSFEQGEEERLISVENAPRK